MGGKQSRGPDCCMFCQCRRRFQRARSNQFTKSFLERAFDNVLGKLAVTCVHVGKICFGSLQKLRF